MKNKLKKFANIISNSEKLTKNNLKTVKNSKNKRRDGDLNPGDLLIIGLAVRRRTRLGHPDSKKTSIIKYIVKTYL